MSPLTNLRRKFFANPLHREMFFLVFGAMVIPATITAVGLFYLIFNLTADEAGIPETIGQIVIPAAERVISILLVGVPLVMLGIIFLAYKITHRIVGPFDRVVRELNECLAGTRRGPIKLRPNDRFLPLVELINKLLEKL